MHSYSTRQNICLFSLDRSAIEYTFSLLKYRKEETKYLRFFYPKKDPRRDTDKGRKLEVKKVYLRPLNSFQKDGRGAYFVVNGGGHLDRDVRSGRAVFIEHDNLAIDKQINLWRTLLLPEPTFQVSTGGKSIHSYWVFKNAIDIEIWRVLQRDLLNFTNGDPVIKNPSRVMRLPGCFHITYNQGNQIYSQTLIIRGSEQYYSFFELRSHIPLTIPKLKSTLSLKTKTVIERSPSPKLTIATPKKRIRSLSDIPLPLPIPVPLFVCLSRQSRSYLEGVSEGSRNGSGVRLALDLIGTYNYLTSIEQAVEGDPRDYFEMFAAKCIPPMEDAEVKSIWQWAERENSTPSSTAEGVDNCLRGFYWREYVKSN
jgi:hypothetical protein